MNGPVAQCVVLSCHANASLKGIAVPDMLAKNSTFVFCDSVKFVQCTKKLFRKKLEEQIASDANGWFQKIKSDGVDRVLLHRQRQDDPRIPDRMSAAFVGGGGTWMLETVGRSTSSIWLPRWEVYDQNAANRRIWRVTYHSTSTRSLSFPQPDLGKSEARLVAALTDVKQFSERSGLTSFTLCFARAMETIQSRGTVQYSYHRDLAPAGVLSRQALYLLDACQSAWVFGGMGSWNDMCFEGSQEEEYARVSEELFEAVNACIEDATNSVIEPSLRET